MVNNSRRFGRKLVLGFTLVEALVAVTVLGLLSSIGFVSYRGLRANADERKLEQDVAVINSAIDTYLSAGGSLDDVGTEEAVLEKLKTTADAESADRVLGLKGPFIDPRTTIVRQTAGEAESTSLRAYFDGDGEPRFYTANAGAGGVRAFVLEDAVISAATGEGRSPVLAQATEDAWVWDYTDRAPTAQDPFSAPRPEDTGPSTNVGQAVLPLSPPTFSPEGGARELSQYPLSVNLINPNDANPAIGPRASRIYYSIGSPNGPFLLFSTPIQVAPETEIWALCVSLDPSRYSNSGYATADFGTDPLQLVITLNAPGSMTYAQAGGMILNQAPQIPLTATVSLSVSIPAPYLNNGNFEIRYTTDGSNPMDSGAIVGPGFSGSFVSPQISLSLATWGSRTQLLLRVVAKAKNTALFSDSPEASTTVAINPTALALNILPANPVGLPPQVQINESGTVPVGLRKFYTTTGSAPLSATSGGTPLGGASLYTIPFRPAPTTSYVLTAQATGPPGFEPWFSSAPASRTYNVVTVLNPNFVGANISGGDISGALRGSIFVSAPAELGVFNAAGQITGGSIYLPGTPAVEIPGSGNSTKTAVGSGQAYSEQGEIPRSLVAGKEYTATGELAVPQLDTRQVVDLDGSLAPTNYTFKLTKSTFIEGKIYRRADPPPVPAVPTVPTGLTVQTNSISGVFQTNIPAGVYSNLITMNSASSILRLGEPGGAVSQYVFAGNTWNKGTVEILGPVEIYFLDGFDNKGVNFGSASTATQARYNVMTNKINITGDGSLYGDLWGANSDMTVGNGSTFVGNIYVRTLTVSPGGTVNVE